MFPTYFQCIGACPCMPAYCDFPNIFPMYWWLANIYQCIETFSMYIQYIRSLPMYRSLSAYFQCWGHPTYFPDIKTIATYLHFQYRHLPGVFSTYRRISKICSFWVYFQCILGLTNVFPIKYAYIPYNIAHATNYCKTSTISDFLYMRLCNYLQLYAGDERSFMQWTDFSLLTISTYKEIPMCECIQLIIRQQSKYYHISSQAPAAATEAVHNEQLHLLCSLMRTTVVLNDYSSHMEWRLHNNMKSVLISILIIHPDN